MILTSRTGVSRDLLVMGTEGGQEREHVLPNAASISRASIADVNSDPTLSQQVPRWSLWTSAVARNSSTPEHRSMEMDYKFEGIVDHGAAYAPNSFEDPLSGRRIVWSWPIEEEDVPVGCCEYKGWTGCITLPRKLFLFEIDHVVSGFRSSIEELACTSEADTSRNGGYTVRTLGIQPFERLQKLRRGPPSAHIDKLCKLALPLTEPYTTLDGPTTIIFTDIPVPDTRWEQNAAIIVHNHCSAVGFRLSHGNGTLGSTKITFHPQNEEIVVKRPRSKNDRWPVNKREERGAHILFKYANGVYVTGTRGWAGT